MLLTVIAVATLLVAVVGATFAYFSLSTTGESQTNGTISTPKIGTVTISGSNPTLLLNLTAEDMLQGEGDQVYYASTTGEDKQTATPIPIAEAELTDAEEGTSYQCETEVVVKVVTPDLEATNMADKLKEGWAELKLSGTGAGAEEQTIDLYEIKDTPEGRKITGTATVTMGSPKSPIVNAVLSFTNKHDEEQNEIANSTLKVEITVTGSKCTLQEN